MLLPFRQSLLIALPVCDSLAQADASVLPAWALLAQAAWVAGVARLGIPDLRPVDGQPGRLVRYESAGAPVTMAAAAAFERADAAANGAVICCDARAIGVNVVLPPYGNSHGLPFEAVGNARPRPTRTTHEEETTTTQFA